MNCGNCQNKDICKYERGAEINLDRTKRLVHEMLGLPEEFIVIGCRKFSSSSTTYIISEDYQKSWTDNDTF